MDSRETRRYDAFQRVATFGTDNAADFAAGTIGSLIAQGMKALTTLDAIMHNKYGSNPDKLAAWFTASHIERDAKRGKSQPQPVPQTPPKNP
jgi:hypothetical protein